MNNFRLTYLIVLLFLGMNLIVGIAPAQASAIGDGSVNLTAEEVEWLKKHPVITLAPDPDFHPIEFFDAQGKYKGISADYTALFEEKLGIDFKTVNLKRWDKVLEQAKGRKVDMFGAATKSPQREEYMLFTEPHIELPGVFLTRSGNGDTYTMKQLQGLRVAVVSGYIWQDFIENDYPEMDLYLVPNIESALEELSLGTVDVFINDMATASYYIEQSGITNLRTAGETGYFLSMAFASRSDWPILNAILQKALVQISPAEKETIYKKWVHLDQHGWKPTREFIAILTAALLLLSVAGTLLWSWALKKQIAYQTDEMKSQLQKIEEAEQMLHVVLDTIPNRVFWKDRDLNYLGCNEIFAKDAGVDSSEEIVGKTDFDLAWSNEAPIYRADDSHVMDTGEAKLHYEEPQTTKEGNVIWLETSKIPLRDAKGNIYGVLGTYHDITAKKEADMTLLESHDASINIMEDLHKEIAERTRVEAQLRKLTVAVEQNPATIVITDIEGNIEYVNPHFTKSTGYTVEEAIGQNPRILKSGDQSDEFYKELWDTITAGKTWEGDFHNKRKNGELYWESASISPIKDDNGDVNHFIAIKTDVTVRRAQEEEIRRRHIEEEILNYLLSLSLEDMAFNELIGKCLEKVLSVPFIPFKPKGAIFTVAEGTKYITMVSQRGMNEDLSEKCSNIPFGKCLCGRVAQSGKTEFADSIDGRHDITYEGMLPHGHYCVPIKRQKEVLGVIALYLDEGCSRNEDDVTFLESIATTIAGIIERKRIEDKLKESEKKHRDIITTTREGYWLLDMDRNIMDVNSSLCLMLGYPQEEMIGKCPIDFTDEENAKIFRSQSSKIATTAHRVYEITLKSKDGRDVPAIFHATTIKDSEDTPTGAFVFITDISDLKKTEVSLRLAKDEAEGATMLKDKFVSLVSHDLKNPIHRIMMYFELLEMGNEVSESGNEMIKEGLEACDEMTSLINDVFSLTRIKGGKIMPEYAFVCVHETINQARNNYQRIATDKGVEIINEVPETSRIYVDEKLLLEVFRNLISNAVKFCKKGDRVRLYMPDGEPATIAVADTGTGIKYANMSTLFSYEEKTSTKGTSGEMGTGFGLPLCHEIVAAHSGRLEIESEVDKGSTFYIRLPDVKPTVLIVDDDESIRELFKNRLEKLDIVLLDAASGEEVLEMIKGNRPHLFFIDLHMPGMGGLELLDQIRKEPETEKIPVIVVTADKTLEVVDQAFQRGADDFIVKPFEKGDLIESVERFLA